MAGTVHSESIAATFLSFGDAWRSHAKLSEALARSLADDMAACTGKPLPSFVLQGASRRRLQDVRLRWACEKDVCDRHKVPNSSVLEGPCWMCVQESCRATAATFSGCWRLRATWQLYRRQPPPSWQLSSLVCPNGNPLTPSTGDGHCYGDSGCCCSGLMATQCCVEP